jgi:hypothetical protein
MQHLSIAGAHPADLRLHPVEVSGDEQVGLAVSVHIPREDSVHRGQLRRAR